MPFDILAHTVNSTGGGNFVVQNTTLSATIIDADTITFDGGATFRSYTYLGQGNYRGTGQSGEFIEVEGEIYAYASDNPTGPLRTGNWQISGGDLDPTDPPCFLAGTLIATPQGEVPIERLSAGDRVVTASGRVARILWAGARRVPAASLKRDPRLRAVVIGEGALGNDRPLTVSQQHRVLVAGGCVELWFGLEEILVPAKALLASGRAWLMGDGEAITYHHLLLEQHDVILANGVAAESLFLGPRGLGPTRSDLEKLYPCLAPGPVHARPARPFASIVEGRAFFARADYRARGPAPLLSPAEALAESRSISCCC
ncbi:Hint domain-containing protein [Tropicimonas sediminicola]|uniref:Hint domain-containing protein n=1 Tax=Tropicimonas sediminicola TaxID=1031541 RepID=A0A239EJL1_9RHOB|nr:Hint domain-containing protein [Tropicimonas sediminicola]SNS44817.1 Hint domain-containing protein [Tropicimonas sediminicola]